MTKLDWLNAPRYYEDGLDRGVLYTDGVGVVWNGLVSVTEEPSDEQQEHYIDGNRVLLTVRTGDFVASVEAYTFPDEFEEHGVYFDEVTHKRFGLSYRTHSNSGSKIHIIYNAWVPPTSRSWSTISDISVMSVFRWELLAASVPIPGARPASHLIIDTGSSHPSVVAQVEDWLYGTDETDPRLPDPEEIVDIYEAVTSLKITNHGDGTYTAEASDDSITDNLDGSFDIAAPTVFLIEQGVFTASSF